MLEKQRESLAASKNYQKVKLHLQKNKNVYLAGGAGVGIGLVLKQRPQITHVTNNLTPSVAPVFNNHNIGNVVNTTVNNGGYARKIIRCVETDEMWPSMTKAASSAGHTLQAMSRHIHGYNEHLDGLHYVIEGISAS